VTRLTTEYDHDYGTICHAIARSGAWAESSDGENWRYTGVVLPVADNELPGFLR
jgi:hypothetical protein